MNKYVLMITPNNFPNGDAGSVRDFYFAKIYQEIGYKVIYIGMNRSENGIYKDIQFYSLYEKRPTFVKKVISFCTYGKRLTKVYEEIRRQNGDPSIIHIYDIPYLGIKFAKNLAKKYTALFCMIVLNGIQHVNLNLVFLATHIS